MGRILLIIIVILVGGASIFVITNAKNMYKVIPVDLPAKQLNAMDDSKYDNWKEIQSKNGEFTVQFPVLPQHTYENRKDPQTQEVRRYDIYVSEKGNGTIFMITMITFPAGKITESGGKLLNNAMNDMLQTNSKNKLKTMKIGSFQKAEALDFSIENDQIVIDGKAFMLGNTLYVLSAIGKNETYNTKEFDHFANSFKLKSQNAEPVKPLEPAKAK